MIDRAEASDATVVALGVYAHWPYCTRICPYCDFNVYKDRSVDADQWAQAFLSELRYWAARIEKRPLRSLYFGGGTPSLAPISVIERVIEGCEKLFGFEPGAEITLEANPTSAEEALFSSFQHAGVNRLSLGVQSLRDEALQFLGRDHSADEARGALARALAIFPKSSFDLIYARPGQSLQAWRGELDEALGLGAQHLSLYQLTIEAGTAFDRAVTRGAWTPPDEGRAADMFDMAQEMTAAAGLVAYEVSNHAAPAACSKHNLLYWRQQDYIGIGPGAHGRLTLDGARLASQTHRNPSDYLKAVAAGGVSRAVEERLDDEAQLTERLSMGLRLAEGCALAPAQLDLLIARRDRLETLVGEGLLARDGNGLAATPEGRRVLNAVLSYLLA